MDRLSSLGSVKLSRPRPAQPRRKTVFQEEGFSLVEILIVVVVIAILAAIVLPIFLNQRAKARDSIVMNDIKDMSTVVSTQMVGNPSSISGGDGSSTGMLIFDSGAPQQKKGISTWADAYTHKWCVSKQSESGKIFVSNSTASTTYAAQTMCASASDNPAAEN